VAVKLIFDHRGAATGSVVIIGLNELTIDKSLIISDVLPNESVTISLILWFHFWLN